MGKFRKTFIMNLVGAAGWLVVGVALFLNKIGEQSLGILTTIVVMYSMLVLIPAGTAFALTTNAPRSLQRGMLWANWALIALWLLSLIAAVIINQPLALTFLGALALVVPEAINIKALQATLLESDVQAQKGSAAGAALR